MFKTTSILIKITKRLKLSRSMVTGVMAPYVTLNLKYCNVSHSFAEYFMVMQLSLKAFEYENCCLTFVHIFINSNKCLIDHI